MYSRLHSKQQKAAFADDTPAYDVVRVASSGRPHLMLCGFNLVFHLCGIFQQRKSERLESTAGI